MGRFSVKKIRKLLFIKFNNKLALIALHSVLETTLIRKMHKWKVTKLRSRKLHFPKSD